MKGVKATSWVSDLIPGDNDPRHGHGGYTNHGCRCDICRAANREYNLAARAARRQRLTDDPSLAPHGIYTTYVNWGCRCAQCSQAASAYARNYYVSRRASA